MRKVFLGIIISIFLATSVFAANLSELISKGDKACKIGNFMAAKKFYKQAIQQDPKNEKLWKKYDNALKMLYGGDEEGGGC
jgi:predicted NACHT family NTPase